MVGVGFTITLTSSDAVKQYLPGGGKAEALTENHTNPVDANKLGILAGQMTALSLNVGFDRCDPDFSSSWSSLGDQVYCAEGPCKGMTVSAILTLGNQVLGGGSIPSHFNIGVLNTCVTTINENYDNGDHYPIPQDNGHLCSNPRVSCAPSSSPSSKPSLSSVPSSGLTSQPSTGPSSLPSVSDSTRSLTQLEQPALLAPVSSPASPTDYCSTESEVVFEDFEAGFAYGWEGGMTDSSSQLTTFLGRLGQGDVSKSFEVPTDADRMTLEFLLYEIDDWNKRDRFFLEVCSTEIDLGIFESNTDESSVRGRTDGIEWWRGSKAAPEDLGFGEELDQIHRVVLEIPRSCYADTGFLEVLFIADLVQEGAGIDNLKLTAHYKCPDSSRVEEDEMFHIAMPTYLQSLSTVPVGPPKKDKKPVPQSKQTVETTKKLDEVVLENDPKDCDDMTNAILQVPVEGCTTKLPESPIEIVTRGASSVTFTVSQVWRHCRNGNNGWLAADFITTKGDLKCFKTEGGSICPTKATHTASCEEGAVVVDLYAYDDHFFGNNPGQVSVPMACRPSGDRTKTCHYRYVLQCKPKKCEEPKPFRLFGLFGF